MTKNNQELLDKLGEKIKKCQKCSLCKTRTNVVPGEGNTSTEIMFIGEGPGKEEDSQGKPFTGQAGKFLDELLKIIKLERKDVFITNIIKCRPPENRDPLPEEIETCWPYLEQQIKIIKPKLIVTLGRHSMNRFIPGLIISKDHGQAKRYKGIHQEKQVYYPMYHPAVSLYNPSQKETLIYDMKKIPILLRKIRAGS